MEHSPHLAARAGPEQPAVGMLLDLENLLHEARRVSGQAIRHGLVRVMEQLRPLGAPRFVVGVCDWWLAKALCPTAATLGVRVYPGPMGRRRADAELLRRGVDDVPDSVAVLVIGSGDAAFAELVHAHRTAGRRVVVAGRAGRIARCLLADADDVVRLDLGLCADDPPGLGLAAGGAPAGPQPRPLFRQV